MYVQAGGEDKPEAEWSIEEHAIASRSAEVILQGLAEGIQDRARLARFYNRMLGIPRIALHFLIIEALQHKRIPAIFRTNQDQCLEAAALERGFGLEFIYDIDGFTRGLYPAVYQFHGAIGGNTHIDS